MRYLVIMCFVLGFLAMPLESLHATPFTPLKWQDKITKHIHDKFIGQRKHATWVRDRNRNFIDDIIDRRVQKKEKKFDVIVDLNTFLTLDHIRKKFDGYGEVKYIGKMITFVLLNNVEANDLSKIAKMDAVAMIEIQRVFQPALDTSARAVQAKACETCPYSDATAEYTGYTGSKINIAIIDTGVDDDHEQFTCKFIAGFDATVFEDTDHNGVDDLGEEPADGTTNPDDDWNGFNSEGHGTHVAGIALGKGVAGRDCRNLVNEEGNCGGVAREAGLVDIKVCYMKKCEDFVGCAEAICETSDMAEALDWLGFNFDKDGVKVRVANISLTYATEVNESGHTVWDDDGTDAIAQQVNYLSALGILMVAAHGNSIPNFSPGDRVTHSPGSASFAVTVSGTNDKETVTRSDDDKWDKYLVGPRFDFVESYDILALKPDISAPAQMICSAEYNTEREYRNKSGTSMAAPHVSGAAAIILQANPEMNPGDVKDVLKRTADTSKNDREVLEAEFAGVDPDWNWDKAFGWGMLNVNAAIDLVAGADVGFPTCSGPPSNRGGPCALSGGLPSWNNIQDIFTTAPPEVGVENQIQAVIKNSGPNDATVLVNFGVYIFAVGNNRFFHIGTKEVKIRDGSTQIVGQPWTPGSADHQCIQVSIDNGLDTDFDNNVTQRNLLVAPSYFTMRVENPFPVSAEFTIRPKSRREGWVCRVDEPKFMLHPYRDPPKLVKINFNAPKTANPGERAECDIAVFAGPIGAKQREIGGVTVQTFVPKPY